MRTLAHDRVVDATAALPRREGASQGLDRLRLTVAAPIAVSLVALAALVVLPGLGGLAAAIGAAFAWTWWLDGQPDGGSERTDVRVVDGEVSDAGAPVIVRHPAERVLVAVAPNRPATIEIEAAAALAGRLGGTLTAAYVMTEARRDRAGTSLAANLSAARAAGATVVEVVADDVVDGLLALADREGITHVVLGCSGAVSTLFEPTSTVGRFVTSARGLEISIIRQSDSRPTARSGRTADRSDPPRPSSAAGAPEPRGARAR